MLLFPCCCFYCCCYCSFWTVFGAVVSMLFFLCCCYCSFWTVLVLLFLCCCLFRVQCVFCCIAPYLYQLKKPAPSFKCLCTYNVYIIKRSIQFISVHFLHILSNFQRPNVSEVTWSKGYLNTISTAQNNMTGSMWKHHQKITINVSQGFIIK